MNLVELGLALRKLRLTGIATVLEARLRQAQTEKMAPIDLVSLLVGDELLRREDRLLGADTNTRAFAIPTARWTVLILISTRT